MSDNLCQHKVLGDIRVARCESHSQVTAGIEVWMWSTRPLSPSRCECEDVDRFVIASDMVDARLTTGLAEVVLCSPRNTLRGALGVAELRLDRHPGCKLVAVPAERDGTVFWTHTHRLVVGPEQVPPPVCEVCLYPWLAVGHSLDELS